MKDGKFLTMAIESSCDETSVAVLADGRQVLSNIISSQIDVHTAFGGVVPEIASRHHLQNMNTVIDQSLEAAGVTLDDIDLLGVTYGPGLVGALLMGVATAKGISFAKDIPLVGVNHMHGHISANFIEYPQLEPPFMSLIVSGGHTNIVHMKDYGECEVLGGTRDDAVGEAYDKVARVIGLGYPGGPKIDKLAYEGEPNIELPKSKIEGLNFSFSGIKTAVINLNHKNPNINKADLCASFEKVTTEMLIKNVLEAIEQTGIREVVLAGGVSANSYIREQFKKLEKEQNIKVYYPELKLCTDNAAMIAAAGYYNYIAGKESDLSLNAIPNLKLGG